MRDIPHSPVATRSKRPVLFWMCLLILLIWHVSYQPAVARPSGHRITIASYNLWNFFDVFDDPYTNDETTRVKPYDQIQAMAKAIMNLNADVIAFQEVENVHVLKAMVLDFMPNAGYTYIATSASNSERGMTVGVISRLPIVSVTGYRFADLKIPGDKRVWHFARNLMHVRFQVLPDHILDLFVVHFKSRRSRAGDPRSAHWRLAEAVKTRQIIANMLKNKPGAWIVLTGDFNDTPDSSTLQQFLGKPALLKDMHAHLAGDQRITYLGSRHRSTIDYLLASPAMSAFQIKSIARVLHDPTLLHGSDHAPIVAGFNLP